MVDTTTWWIKTGIHTLSWRTLGRGRSVPENWCPQLLLPEKDRLLPEEKDRSMLIEIVCELADMELCRTNKRHSMKCVMRTGYFWKNIKTNSTKYTTDWKGAYWIIWMNNNRYNYEGKSIQVQVWREYHRRCSLYGVGAVCRECLSLIIYKNEYGNVSEDIFHVVCKIENVFFSCGQYSRRFLDKEERKEITAAYCKNWITNILQDLEKEFIFLFFLSVCLKLLGLILHLYCKPVKRT